MKKRILIINDSESLSEILQFYLEMKDFEVILAIDGYQGIEKAQTYLPDLILLDVIMPGIDGFEVCAQLKKNHATKEIPVIFLSSLTDTNDKVRGLESGGVDFITNTADQPELLARIGTHLKISELTQKLQASNQELRLKQKALKDDLYAAAMIQQSLLPARNPNLPPFIETAWSCLPCETIGGDICNISSTENSHYLVAYILDVSGHGVPSAMVTVSVTQYLRQQQELTPHLSPKDMLKNLNQEYPFEKFNMFSTLFYMILNTENGKFVYSNAGHPAAVYLSPNKPYRLFESTGPMIGVENTPLFEEVEETLLPGEKVILYTDGITEYRNDQGEFYGSERLFGLLEENKSRTVKELIELISRSLNEFGNGCPSRDDISILGIAFK